MYRPRVIYTRSLTYILVDLPEIKRRDIQESFQEL